LSKFTTFGLAEFDLLSILSIRKAAFLSLLYFRIQIVLH